MRPGAISRRQFVVGAGAVGAAATALGSVAGCGRLPGPAEPKVYRVGWLDDGTSAAWYEAFQHGMRDQGYVEGQNLVIEVRAGSLEDGQVPARARDLVQLAPEVIVAAVPSVAIAARDATTTIPIVFGISSDPIGEGLVASFARPGGNVTGLSVMNTILSGKRVEVLGEAVPTLRRLALLYQPLQV